MKNQSPPITPQDDEFHDTLDQLNDPTDPISSISSNCTCEKVNEKVNDESIPSSFSSINSNSHSNSNKINKLNDPTDSISSILSISTIGTCGKVNEKVNDESIDSNSPSNSYNIDKLNAPTASISSISSIGTSSQVNEKVNEQVNDESISSVDFQDSGQDLVFMLIGFIIDVIVFEFKLLVNSFNFFNFSRFWFLNFSRFWDFSTFWGIWEFCYNGVVKLIGYVWYENYESAVKVCVRVGWVVLWMGYCGVVLVCLLVPALVTSGVVVKRVVEEPVRISEQLVFDYTEDSPVAFVPVMSCMGSSSLLMYKGLSKSKSGSGSFEESRVVPFEHDLMATVSLTLPESDYNRNLGIFLVRVDFLSSDGKLLASTRKPCMLPYKSDPIRFLSTFIKVASLLTGYPPETQTLDIKFSDYTEKDFPLSCLKVVIEQRAEFAKGRGVPEIYSASLKLESQLPFLKRMLWYWKGLIFMWVSIMIFSMELLITLLCCTPVIFPSVRRLGSSSITNTSHNMPPSRS